MRSCKLAQQLTLLRVLGWEQAGELMPKGLVRAPTSDAFCTGIPPRHATRRVELEAAISVNAFTSRSPAMRGGSACSGDAVSSTTPSSRVNLPSAVLRSLLDRRSWRKTLE